MIGAQCCMERVAQCKSHSKLAPAFSDMVMVSFEGHRNNPLSGLEY